MPAQASIAQSLQSITQQLLDGFIYDKNGTKLSENKVGTDEVNWRMPTTKEGHPFTSSGLILRPSKKPGEGLKPFCSGTLLDVGGDAGAPAYVITAGHCMESDSTDNPETNKIYVNESATLVFRLNNLIDAGSNVIDLKVKRFVYSTMKTTDFSIMELNETYQSLAKRGFKGVKIAKVAPQSGDAIALVSTPLRGMQDPQRFVHYAECTVRGIYDVIQAVAGKEGVEAFRIDGNIFHDCSSVEGTSGGAIIARKTNDLVGIVSWVEKFEQREELLPEDSTRQAEGYNGASQITPVGACFNKRGVFDLTVAGCKLETPPNKGESQAAAAGRNCNAVGKACFETAYLVLKDLKQGDSTGLRIGLSFADRGCQLGEGISCGLLGEIFAGSGDTAEMKGYSFKYFTLGCAAGNLDSCIGVANAYEAGKGVSTSLETAMNFNLLACRFGRVSVCDKVGAAYFLGKGLPLSKELAAQSFAKSCLGGHIEGCKDLATMYETGNGVTKSLRSAAGVYFGGCKLKDAPSCFRLGEILRDHSSNAEGKEASKQFFDAACQFGMKEACALGTGTVKPQEK